MAAVIVIYVPHKLSPYTIMKLLWKGFEGMVIEKAYLKVSM